MTQLRERYHFIHNVFASFFKDVLDWSSVIYPRFEYKIIGTYDKGVEYIQKQCQYGREIDKPMLPALILNPSGEFAAADANAGGRQLWRYPNLAPTQAKRLFNPIYRDDNIYIYPGFLRVKGEIELIMLLNSFYEYCDIRLLFINMFGGLDRIIYPQFFSSFIVLPESFVNYQYLNTVTGQTYQLDWSGANASEQLVRSTARNELVLPLNIKPQLTLTNLSDASNRYGGTDSIAEWKLQASLNYEVEMPNYLVVESDYLAQRADIEIRFSSVYSEYNDYQPPVNRYLFNVSWDWNLTSGVNSADRGALEPNDATSTISFTGDFVYKTRYFHTITVDEVMDSTANLVITIPEAITIPKVLIVNSKNAELTYGDHYLIENNGTSLVLNRDTVPLTVGQIFELYVYEAVGIEI